MRSYFPVGCVSGTNEFILSTSQPVEGDRAHVCLPAPRVMHRKGLSPGLCQGFIHQCRHEAVMEPCELTGTLCDFLFTSFGPPKPHFLM